MQGIADQKLYRIIDANFNRAKEGLRVCEDICRFIYNKKSATKKYKTLRHNLTDAVSSLKVSKIIGSRDIRSDVGRQSIKLELKRKNVGDIFYANSQRVKESVRVLEEFLKLTDTESAKKTKLIRYQIYELEKEIVKKR